MELAQCLLKHFSSGNLPVIADDGMYSYCILGTRGNANALEIFEGDPHRWSGTRPVQPEWKRLEDFVGFDEQKCWALLFVSHGKHASL